MNSCGNSKRCTAKTEFFALFGFFRNAVCLFEENIIRTAMKITAPLTAFALMLAAAWPAEASPTPDRKPKPHTPAALAYHDTDRPAVVFQSLLEEVKVHPRSGRLLLNGTFTASFLPAKEESGATAIYGTVPGTHHLSVHLLRGETPVKKYLARVDQRKDGAFHSQRPGPFADFTLLTGQDKQVEKQGYDTGAYHLSDGGDYALHFYLDGQLFYRFPFQARVHRSDDPYAEDQHIYSLDGPWGDYLLIDVPRPADPDAHAHLAAWLRLPEFDEKGVLYLLHTSLQRNGEELLSEVVPRVAKTYEAKPVWTYARLHTPMPHPDPKSSFLGEPLTYRELLRDGTYQFAVSYYSGYRNPEVPKAPHIGPNGAHTDVYTFQVEDGHIVPQGAQLRDGTDHARFIEGGGTAFWIPRVK